MSSECLKLMNTTIPLMVIFRVCHKMVTGPIIRDNLIIRATADALNIEVHIILFVQETLTITFRPITNNPTQTIFLGHIAHLHYVSARNLSEPQVMQYGGCTNDGVRLIKTYIINNVLAWLFPTMSRYQEIPNILGKIQYLKN